MDREFVRLDEMGDKYVSAFMQKWSEMPIPEGFVCVHASRIKEDVRPCLKHDQKNTQ
mgnify:CR=1 FL=1